MFSDTAPPVCEDFLTELTECIDPYITSVIIPIPEPSCADESGTGKLISRVPISNEFQVGTTDVTFICSDASGNTAECVMSVVVIQSELVS